MGLSFFCVRGISHYLQGFRWSFFVLLPFVMNSTRSVNAIIQYKETVGLKIQFRGWMWTFTTLMQPPFLLFVFTGLNRLYHFYIFFLGCVRWEGVDSRAGANEQWCVEGKKENTVVFINEVSLSAGGRSAVQRYKPSASSPAAVPHWFPSPVLMQWAGLPTRS